MIEFIIETIIFMVFSLTSLYLPSKLILRKLHLDLDSPEDIFLPFGLGICIFTLIAYIFSWLKLEIIILPLIGLLDFYAIKYTTIWPKKIDKRHWASLTLVSIFSVIFSLSVLITGKFGDMLTYVHDDLWHLALINELKVNFPPSNPGFAGIPLKGYHFFYDFFVAKISNIFFISPFSLYFRFMPVFLGLLWGVGVYALMYKWTKKRSAGLWSVFLSMFGGSFAFIFVLQGHSTINLNSGLGIGQALFSLTNPPLSISFVILLTALFSLHQFFFKKRTEWLVPITICIGLISMFKVYAGIVLIGAFLCLTLIQVLKKQFSMVISLGIIGILFFGTYFIFVGGSGSLIFFPLWAPNDLLRSFPWYNYDNKISVYSHLHVIRGLIETEVYGIMLFIFGNLGTRLLGTFGLLYLMKKQKSPSLFGFFLIIMTIISILIPLFFIQTGKVFEIIQMAQYYLLFFSLFAGFGLSTFFSLTYNKYLKISLGLIIILFTIPSVIPGFIGYYHIIRTAQSLHNPYFKSMDFLSKQGQYNSTVLELPQQNVKATDSDVLAWYYSSSPHITALANKHTYFNSEYIDFLNLNIHQRVSTVKKIIKLVNALNTTSKSTQELYRALKNIHIYYIYSTYALNIYTKETQIKTIYTDHNNYIYQIN